MPTRALVEKRPWLLASIAAAIAYYLLKDDNFPGLYLLAIEAAALLLLAAYALYRLPGGEARMTAAIMALSGIGVVAVELEMFVGALILILGQGLAIALFLQHRREFLSGSQKAAAVAFLLLTPAIAAALSAGDPAMTTTATYGLAIGGMAGAAWTSAFPRYRVGLGAAFYVASSLLSIAGAGPLLDRAIPGLLAWPLFYLGHFLICTGVVQTLRARPAGA